MSAGIRAKFEMRAVSGKSPLAENSRRNYWNHLVAFHRFCQKPATQWRGKDVSAWMFHLERERYSIPSRRQKLCAVVWAFKNVIEIDPGILDLPLIYLHGDAARGVSPLDAQPLQIARKTPALA